MNEYKVLFRMQIHGSFAAVSSNDIWLKKWLILPFIPFVGLKVTDSEWTEEITSLTWNNQDKYFLAYTNSENKEIYYALLNRKPHRPIQEIVAEYLAIGWQEDSPNRSL
jgi:hypothetical protein